MSALHRVTLALVALSIVLATTVCIADTRTNVRAVQEDVLAANSSSYHDQRHLMGRGASSKSLTKGVSSKGLTKEASSKGLTKGASSKKLTKGASSKRIPDATQDPKTLRINIANGAAFRDSIETARREITTVRTMKGERKKAKGSTSLWSYPTLGWKMEIYDSADEQFDQRDLKASIPMGDNIYLAFEGVRSDNYGAIPSWKWTREELEAGLTNPLATEVRSVYAIAEAIRFDWMRNRMATIFDVDRRKYSNAGFKTPKEHILNNWGWFHLRIDVGEREAGDKLKDPKDAEGKKVDKLKPFQEQWFPANMPHPSGYEENGDPKETITPVGAAISDDEDEEKSAAARV